MKKNIVFGMLVSLLAIPMYTQAQKAPAMISEEVATDNGSASKEAEKAAKAAAKEAEKAEKAAAKEAAKAEKDAAKEAKKAAQPAGVHYSTGSVISVGFGAGCGGMQTTGDNITSKMAYPTYNVGLRYTYFFKKFMGFTTGVDFSSYNATFGLKGILDWNGVTTGYNEMLTPTPYSHRLNFDAEGKTGSKWSELETIGMVEVPIALTFKAKPNKVGFLGTLGLKLGFPVTGSYKYEGTLNHTAYFDNMGYLEVNPDRYMMNDKYEDIAAIKYDKKVWNVLNCGVFAEAGILFQVHPRVDMSLSIYGSYYINSVNGTPDEDRQKLGFASANNNYATANNGEMQSIMNQYNGLIGTDVVDRINPFSCGVKLALHINCSNKSDEQRAAELYVAPEIIHVYDTVNTISVQLVHDTLVQEVRIPCDPEYSAEEKEIIYYQVGDASSPVIQPANLLDKLAAKLKADPEMKIVVAGHASPEGNPIYNEILAQKRADKIAKMLIDKGVNKYQLIVRSYGSERPSNVTGIEDLVKDRRVEIIPDEQ